MAEFHGKFAAVPHPELIIEEFAWARFIDLTKRVITNHLLPNLKASTVAFGVAAALAHKMQTMVCKPCCLKEQEWSIHGPLNTLHKSWTSDLFWH